MLSSPKCRIVWHDSGSSVKAMVCNCSQYCTQRWSLRLLLCEFARNKENPSLERYITPPISTVSYMMAPYCDARLTIASFSAEPPVIRGHGHSPASRCFFVRDQKPAYASHFRPCWPSCRHKEGNEVAVVTLFIPERACLDPCRALPQSVLSFRSMGLMAV
jgi:hypothetical protein